MKRLCAIILWLGLSGVACSTGDGDDSQHRDIAVVGETERGVGTADTDLAIVRGHYVYGHEVRTLRPCGASEALWVDDQTHLLRSLHDELTPGHAPYAEVFVVVAGRLGAAPETGFGADHSQSLSVEEVIYAAGEGFGCEFDWNRFRYRAQGNEPFWTLQVFGNAMRLSRPGQNDQKWTAMHESRTADTVIFQAASENGSRMELVIQAGPSRDSMSGAYYGLSAKLTIDAQIFTGYALRGALGTTD